MPWVELADIPDHSALRRRLEAADFHDSYRFPLADPTLSPLGIFLTMAAQTPAWVDAMMWVRNRIVRLAGLKDLGALGAVDPLKPAASYRPGDRVGIFVVQEIAESEVVLGQQDRHLDVWLSVCRLPPDDHGHHAVLTTLVQTKNTLGRVYMAVVKPFHRVIAPATIARVTRRAG